MHPNNSPIFLSERIDQGSLCTCTCKRKGQFWKSNTTTSSTKKEVVKVIKITPHGPEQLHANGILSSQAN